MEEYLAFIDEIGRTIEGNYLYRFDFTTEPDAVWGEYFYVIPAVIIPNLQPDKNTLSKSGRVELPIQLMLGKKSGCFSMQDCFDNIIPLGFSPIDEEPEIILKFGEPYEEVIEKLHKINTDIFDITSYENNSEELIDDLIEKIKETPKTNFGTILDEAINDTKENLFKEILTLKKGNEISFDFIKQTLYEAGYEHTDFVNKKGQYTIRGGFIDIFSYYFKYDKPFRISFFGDEIEDIYSFDIMEQTPIEHFNEIIIYKKNDEDGQ